MAIQVAFGLRKLDGRRKTAPNRILLIKDGDPGWAGIDAVLTEESAQQLIAEFEAQGADIPIDHHHATLKVERGETDKAPAAGWIRALEYVPGRGLFGLEIEWTDEATRQIEAGEFQYLSPVALLNKETRAVESLHSVALTNRPRTRDQIRLLEAAERLERHVNQESDDMASKTVPKEKDKELVAAQEEDIGGPAVDPTQKLLAGLVMALQEKGVQVADEAPLNDVLRAAIEAIGGGAIEEPTGEEEVDMEKKPTEPKAEAVPAELRLKAAAYDTMNDRVKVIEADRAATRVDTLIETQIEAGKLLPEDKDMIAAAREYAGSNPDGFEKFYAAMAPICEPGSVVKGQSAAARGGGNTRQRLIAAASREFDDNPKYTSQSTRVSWVNTSLRQEGERVLTDVETKKVEA